MKHINTFNENTNLAHENFMSFCKDGPLDDILNIVRDEGLSVSVEFSRARRVLSLMPNGVNPNAKVVCVRINASFEDEEDDVLENEDFV